MADVSNRAAAVFQDGECFKTALFAVKNASAGDTIDLISWFTVVKRAGLVSATGTTISTVAITNNPTQQPVLATIPAGVTADGVWLLVIGVSA
jgi:hypothetical protein